MPRGLQLAFISPKAHADDSRTRILHWLYHCNLTLSDPLQNHPYLATALDEEACHPTPVIKNNSTPILETRSPACLCHPCTTGIASFVALLEAEAL